MSAPERPIAEMWGVYDYKDHRVMVTQQWQDPYGRRMVRIQVVGPDENLAAGMLEERFLQDAVPVANM